MDNSVYDDLMNEFDADDPVAAIPSSSPPHRSVSVHDDDEQSDLSSQISALRSQMAQMQQQEEQEKKIDREQYERAQQQASFIEQQQPLQSQPQPQQPQPQQSEQQSQPQPQPQQQSQRQQERNEQLSRLAYLEHQQHVQRLEQQQQEARKRVREAGEGPLSLGARKVSPNDSAIVRYGEAKSFVLQRSDLQLRVQMLNMEIDSLRGNFIRTPEDERIVKKATMRAEAKWTKEGVSKTIRDRRKVVLNTLRGRLAKEEQLFEELRKRIKMLRLQVYLQHVRVEADEHAVGAEEREEERMYRLRVQENKLKAAKQQANIDKQQRKLSMTFNLQMPTAAATAAAAAGIRVGAAASKPRIRRHIIEEDEQFADDVDDPDEDAQHALEDAEEHASAALEQENDDDRAFIASEDEY